MTRPTLSKKAEREINNARKMFFERHGFMPSISQTIDLLVEVDRMEIIKNSETRRKSRTKKEFIFKFR